MSRVLRSTSPFWCVLLNPKWRKGAFTCQRYSSFLPADCPPHSLSVFSSIIRFILVSTLPLSIFTNLFFCNNSLWRFGISGSFITCPRSTFSLSLIWHFCHPTTASNSRPRSTQNRIDKHIRQTVEQFNSVVQSLLQTVSYRHSPFDLATLLLSSREIHKIYPCPADRHQSSPQVRDVQGVKCNGNDRANNLRFSRTDSHEIAMESADSMHPALAMGQPSFFYYSPDPKADHRQPGYYTPQPNAVHDGMAMHHYQQQLYHPEIMMPGQYPVYTAVSSSGPHMYHPQKSMLAMASPRPVQQKPAFLYQYEGQQLSVDTECNAPDLHVYPSTPPLSFSGSASSSPPSTCGVLPTPVTGSYMGLENNLEGVKEGCQRDVQSEILAGGDWTRCCSPPLTPGTSHSQKIHIYSQSNRYVFVVDLRKLGAKWKCRGSNLLCP